MTHWIEQMKEWIRLAVIISSVIALGWFTQHYHQRFDWTLSSRNSLTLQSQKILESLQDPILVTAYISEKKAERRGIVSLLSRYSERKQNFEVRYTDPNSVPEEVRELGIQQEGELRVQYREARERVRIATEEQITNALLRVSHSSKRWIGFTTNHGERDLLGVANHDYGELSKHLSRRGYRLQPLTLTDVAEVPANVSLLIIADPRLEFLPGEQAVIEDYVDSGGNLLVLCEPASASKTARLLQNLGLTLGTSTVIDPTSERFGISDRSVPVITRYPQHPMMSGFSLVTLFPQAGALTSSKNSTWDAEPFLLTSSDSLEETNTNRGVRSLGMALERAHPSATGTQRIIVMGDADFLANTYLGNGGNLDLGIVMVDWLSDDQSFVPIPIARAEDAGFHLSKRKALFLAFSSLFAVPLALIAIGVVIWWRRQHAQSKG